MAVAELETCFSPPI